MSGSNVVNPARVEFIFNSNHFRCSAGNMADQIQRLNSLLKKIDVNLSDDEGDDTTNGEYWEVKDPDRLESWSIALVPMTDNVNFVMKFHAGPHALPISADEQIQEVAYYKGNTVHIHCETIDAEPYSFTVVVNNTMSPFSVVPFLASLQGSSYEPLIKEVESEIDWQVWMTKEGLPLRARSIVSKVRNLIHSMAKMAAARKAIMSALMPVDLSRAAGTQNTSQASGRDTTSHGGPRSAADPPNIRKNKKRPNNAMETTPAGSQVRRPSVQAQAEGSIASALTEVPVELSDGDEEDLEAISKIYNQFWMECQGSYIFEMDEKREVSIDQLDLVPIDWTIRAYEERGMEKMQNYFLNMLDQTARQTLCVMPQCDKKPTSWDEVKDGRFWIINGQHSVAASQSI